MKVERGATPPPATFWKKMAILIIQQRFYRQKEVPGFFGVSRGYFDKNIRPSLTEIWWGDTPQSGISYDVLEMNALADKIVERNGRPAKKGEKIWDVKIENRDCTSSKDPALNSGMYKAPSSANELEKVLKLSQEKRRKSSKLS